MTRTPGIAGATLSPWWVRAVITTMGIGLVVLILLTAKAYQNAPPTPTRVVDASGKVVFTSADIGLGQQVFLKHGLMANGTIWGHGAYLGPEFSAQYLHDLALDLAEQTARQRFARPYYALSVEHRAAVAAVVHGGSPKGAERIAACWADHHKVAQIVFKPDWANGAAPPDGRDG